jgi:hypothetical protein
MMRWAWAVGAAWLLAACGSAPDTAAQLSAAQRSAERTQAQALRAQAQGDWTGAEVAWRNTRDVYASLGLTAQQMPAQLAWARALAELGRGAQAESLLRALVADAATPAGLMPAAHGRLAALRLAQNDAAGALAALTSASAACAQRCPELSALLSIQAQMQLSSRAVSLAQDSAKAALAAAQNDTDRANALRALGQAQLQSSDGAALQSFTQALALDQAAGNAARVVVSLRGLAQAQRVAGQDAQADRTDAQAAEAQAALARLRP